METKKSLEQFDLVLPAKKLLDAVTFSTDALSKKPMNEERYKNMKLTLGFMNAYIKSFHTKVSYFKLVGVPKKVELVKHKFKKKK